jgi:hypothetical protein
VEDLAVNRNRDAKGCFWEALNKSSERKVSIQAAMMDDGNIYALAAVLGPNHCPKIFPVSFPGSARRTDSA